MKERAGRQTECMLATHAEGYTHLHTDVVSLFMRAIAQVSAHAQGRVQMTILTPWGDDARFNLTHSTSFQLFTSWPISLLPPTPILKGF